MSVSVSNFILVVPDLRTDGTYVREDSQHPKDSDYKILWRAAAWNAPVFGAHFQSAACPHPTIQDISAAVAARFDSLHLAFGKVGILVARGASARGALGALPEIARQEHPLPYVVLCEPNLAEAAEIATLLQAHPAPALSILTNPKSSTCPPAAAQRFLEAVDGRTPTSIILTPAGEKEKRAALQGHVASIAQSLAAYPA